MNRVPVIHAGFVKCGSGTLQKHFFDAHPRITNIGKPYKGDVRKGIHDFVDYLTLTSYADYDAERAKAMYDRLVAPELAGDRPVVLADERLTTAEGVDRTLVPYRVKEVFGDCRVVFVIRNQFTFLPSLYVHRTSTGKIEVSFEQWLNSVGQAENSMVKLADYFRLIDVYRKVFGRPNIVVLALEELARDRNAFVDKLCGAVGVEATADLPILHGAVSTPRLSRLQHIKSRSTALTRLERALRRTLPEAALTPLKKVVRAGRRAEPELPPGWRQWVIDSCSEGNRELANVFALPLERYGYPL
jgi:hypothetical protein